MSANIKEIDLDLNGALAVRPDLGRARPGEERQLIIPELVLPDYNARVKLPPNMPQFLRDTYVPRDLFALGGEAWSVAFNADELADRIKRFAWSTDPAHTETDFLWLKARRQDAILSISAWKMYSRDHAAPSNLKKLASHIGALKDARDFPEVRVQAAVKTQRALERYAEGKQKAEDANFRPAELESFLQFYTEHVGRVADYSRQPSLTLDEYHTVRKTLRLLNKHFLFVHELRGSKAANRTHLFLHDLSGTMGKAQDRFIELEHLGLADKHRDQTIIHPQHQAMIAHFLGLHPEMHIRA